MLLKQEINKQLKEAMKAKDTLRLNCLRLMIAALKNQEIEKRGELDDAESLKVLSKLAKQRNESIEIYKNAGRTELADKESAELALIESFLPKALSDEELSKLVDETIKEVEACDPKDMGKVMKVIGPKVAGRADGKKVSEAVRATLAKL
ncbi:MAG: GatB/YqeY domain-containing protein [Pseudomonadota bacterium]